MSRRGRAKRVALHNIQFFTDSPRQVAQPTLAKNEIAPRFLLLCLTEPDVAKSKSSHPRLGVQARTQWGGEPTEGGDHDG